MSVVGLGLAGCMSDSTQLVWPIDDGAQKKKQAAKAEVRKPLDVPPELRGDVSVPEASSIAQTQEMPAQYKKQVAGKAVSLDGKVYETTADRVFSTVIDAMTSLNLPVQSVDSASGTITTDWVKVGANNPNAATMGLLNNMFGQGISAKRYRFVVRVLRQSDPTGTNEALTRLEIRTLGQAFQNSRWVNKTFSRGYANQVFSAVDERLTK